jgi:CheY-like chemotaxis protein
MPVFSVPVANVLNNIYDGRTYNNNKHENTASMTAPEAKVLIVDDIKTNLKVARGLLMPYNMQVDICESGLTAIKMVQEKKYDLIFMDHKMPVMDGIETALHIRGMTDIDPYFDVIPIVALTANAVTGVKQLFLDSGFNDFMSKPIDTIKLDVVLEKWLPKDKQKRR